MSPPAFIADSLSIEQRERLCAICEELEREFRVHGVFLVFADSSHKLLTSTRIDAGVAFGVAAFLEAGIERVAKLQSTAPFEEVLDAVAALRRRGEQ